MAKRHRNQVAAHHPKTENQQPNSERSRVPRHQLHHILRSQIEWDHRDKIVRDSVRCQGPPFVSLDNIAGMRMSAIESCCNKSAPIYILPNNSLSVQHWQLLFVVLHNYLYNIWFQPYRSGIDWGQFIAQVIAIRSTPEFLTTESPTEVAHFVASLSRAICAHTEATQRKIGDRAHSVTPLGEMRELAEEVGIFDWEMIHEQRFHLLQPLFRAVAIVFWGAGQYSVSSISSIAEMPVLLVLTGVEEGLSAAITLDSISDEIGAQHLADDSVKVVETSLATAVRFVMNLEEHPTEYCRAARRSYFRSEKDLASLALRHGWEGDKAVPTGPSSSWVDTTIYREWTGEGARFDHVGARSWEEKCRKMARAVERGENIYT
ncbi:hypothetical protein B0I37DRAFT_394125 [Chaetomium sp. MPI-CAGE-AT-0009]|nr:hypothetical protein B0I37DRAFT_394125 [Chaetomium sp. MPI-CAGE-AT-0009]